MHSNGSWRMGVLLNKLLMRGVSHHLDVWKGLHFMWTFAVQLLWYLFIFLNLFFESLNSTLLCVVVFWNVLFWSRGFRFINLLSIFRIPFFKHCCFSLIVFKLNVLNACSYIWRASWHTLSRIVFLLKWDNI